MQKAHVAAVANVLVKNGYNFIDFTFFLYKLCPKYGSICIDEGVQRCDCVCGGPLTGGKTGPESVYKSELIIRWLETENPVSCQNQISQRGWDRGLKLRIMQLIFNN